MNANVKLKKMNIIVYFLLIPYFEPLLFKENQFALIDNIYTILKIVCLAVILCFFIRYNLKKSGITQYGICVLILECLTLFVTLIKNGDFVKFAGPFVSVISLTMIVEIFFRICKIDFLRIIRNLLTILLVINVILQLIYPTGIISEVNFLGIDNRLVFFYIPLLFVSLIYDSYTKNRVTVYSYLVLILSLWSTISLWAVGGFLGLIIIAITIIIKERIQIIKKISMKQVLLVIIILNLLIVFFQVQKHFESFIVGYLKKDITLTGRTYLWNWALMLIKKNMLFGIGIQSDKYMLGIYKWVVHPHNMFLNYLTTTGIIGFSCFIIMMLIISNKSKEIINENARIITVFTVFVILFLSIADTLDSSMFFLVYGIIYLMHKILEDETKVKYGRF